MTQYNTILDTPTPPPLPPPHDSQTYKWLRGIAVTLEILLWFFGAIGLLFKWESWEYSSELIILCFTSLGMFYLVVTFLVTGARGMPQILGAIGLGFTFLILLIGAIFVQESWEFGHELQLIGLTLGVSALITLLFFLVKTRETRVNTRFYWNALVRLGIILWVIL